MINIHNFTNCMRTVWVSSPEESKIDVILQWLDKANLLTLENRNAIVAISEQETLNRIREVIQILYEVNPCLFTQDYFDVLVSEGGSHALDILFAIKKLRLYALFTSENINTVITEGGGKYASSIAEAIAKLNEADLLTEENRNIMLTGGGKYASFIACTILKYNANLLTLETRNNLITRVCMGEKDISDTMSAIMLYLAPRFLPQVNFDGIIARSDVDLEDIDCTLFSLHFNHFMAPSCNVLTAEDVNAIVDNRDLRFAIKSLSEHDLLTRYNVRAILYDKGVRAPRFLELFREMNLNGAPFNQQVFLRIMSQIKQEECCGKIARALARWNYEYATGDDRDLKIPLEIIQDIATLGPLSHEPWKYRERIEISVREEEQAQLDKREAKLESAV